MQAYWILPNRAQRDDILASDGKTVVPLRRILEPSVRPAGFSHGVPTELLEKCASKALDELMFAQRFPAWNAGKQLFLVSTPAGVDASGRFVHLGILFILEPHERPSFTLLYDGLSKEDQTHARALTERMSSPRRGDSWARSVRELSELPDRLGPATNVELERSVVPFYSLYVLGPHGLVRKAMTLRGFRTRLTIVLIVLTAAGVWLCERACQHSPRPVAFSGAVTCRLS